MGEERFSRFIRIVVQFEECEADTSAICASVVATEAGEVFVYHP
jgi:hypothetical protein